MSLEQVEAELVAADANVAKLREELKAAEAWAADVAVSISVLRRLAGMPERVALEDNHATAKRSAQASPRRKKYSRQEAISEAAREIIEREGHRIKTADLAPMMESLGFNLGAGNPSRVTTDLSNSLARGGKGLTGSRAFGWGLAEWGDERAPGPGSKSELSPYLDAKDTSEVVTENVMGDERGVD